MRFLIIGLGSMGKRRVRCLKALGHTDVAGCDPRVDRKEEVARLQRIPVFTDFEEAVASFKPDILIICVPPQHHMSYIRWAIDHSLHFFVEASVVDDGMAEAVTALGSLRIVAAPSATMMFHPAIMLVRDVVKSGELGKISNVILHSGQYLPDWHTYEKVSDYYVSNPSTSGGREIVPFELTWITKVFGFPKRVAANFRKTITIPGAEKIDDTYNCLLDYGSFLSVLTVDVVSRYATRRLLINGDSKQLFWSWDENCVKVFDPVKNAWEERSYTMAGAQQGYNANIGENMYIEEIKNFIDAIEGKHPFINSMRADHSVLKLLYACEESDTKGRFVVTGE
jgi:predicted dehydrogenase